MNLRVDRTVCETAPACKMQHILILERLYTITPHWLTGDSARTVEEVIDLLLESPNDPYHQHDLAILDAAKDRDGLISSNLSRGRCSAYKLEPIIFVLYQSSDILQKPDHIIGMQKIETLRPPTASKKWETSSLQRRSHGKPTQW